MPVTEPRIQPFGSGFGQRGSTWNAGVAGLLCVGTAWGDRAARSTGVETAHAIPKTVTIAIVARSTTLQSRPMHLCIESPRVAESIQRRQRDRSATTHKLRLWACIILFGLGVAGPWCVHVTAHDIPADVSIQVFARPEG